jgi:hypothetical protein
MSNGDYLKIMIPIWSAMLVFPAWMLYRQRRESKRKPMRVKYRIQVGDQFCEVESDFRLSTTISDLVNGRSKLQKGAVRPEDIHITVHEAAPLPEPEQWQRVEGSEPHR